MFGSCGTTSSSCFLYILTLSCAHTPGLSNDYRVGVIRLKTERWRIFYDEVLFLSFSDSTNESVELTFEHLMYTRKKPSVENEDDGKFSTNHVENQTSCDQSSETCATRIKRRE